MVYTIENSEGDMVPAVLISAEEYESLKADGDLLNCLYSAGVDNWEGYDEALEILGADDEE